MLFVLKRYFKDIFVAGILRMVFSRNMIINDSKKAAC